MPEAVGSVGGEKLRREGLDDLDDDEADSGGRGGAVVKLAEEAVIGELWHRSVWLRCDRGPVRPRS